ncbi:MAG: lysostaphin resistance A-like protein [Haloferacaceae archaeon]
MTNWPAFAGFTGVVLAVLLVLARLSQAALDDTALDSDGAVRTPNGDSVAPEADADRPADGHHAERTADAGDAAPAPFDHDVLPEQPAGPEETAGANEPGADREREESVVVPTAPGSRATPDEATLSTAVLLANVAVSQGLLGTLLLAGAWYTGVPLAALGAGPSGVTPVAAAVGIGLGAALYVANEAGAAVGRHVGLGGGEELREALAPETAGGWVALLFGVLPIIAGFEELLFRGALIGAMSAGFGLSPWPLAVGSSVAFAAGHGAQGRVGVVVTGALGFVLAAAFVVTGSLLTVVVAHYLVNALEFLIHEGADIDPSSGEWRPG